MTLNNFSAAKGDSKGEINLQWDSARNAVSYTIEIANSNPSGKLKWRMLDIISDARYTVRKLKSNKNYFFRVASISRDGRGGLSTEIMKKAP